MISKVYEEFKNSLLEINRYTATNIYKEYYEEFDLIEELVVPILHEIGIGWENGDVSLSQVYMSSVICEELVSKYSVLQSKSVNQDLKVGIVTFDDYHTLGKKIVFMNVKSKGYNIVDLGMIFDEKELIKRVKEEDLDILFMSVLMLPPALRIKSVKEKLLEVQPHLKIVVGGAPFRFDKELYKRIGADAMGSNPYEAIEYLDNFGGVVDE